ncbi:hypothetical protein D0B32_22175 [Paraburkholderia sp. DHOC27]|nr:hypothetical protein D0B32_22175 [Paraburkholderia sp. DHOC27]
MHRTTTPSASTSMPNIPPNFQSVQALIARANAHFNEHRLAEAIAGYEQALSHQPDHLHALHCAGLASFLNKQTEKAFDFLQRALLIAPERADIAEQCGLLAAQTGDAAAAEGFYRRALDLDEHSATIHCNLADCLHARGCLREATVHYVKALELEPDLHHAHSAMAKISAELGLFPDAAHYGLRAWMLDPTRLSTGLDLIKALSKAGRDDEIDDVIHAVRSRFAADAMALKDLANALNGIRRYRDAIEVARQGLQIDPTNERLHMNAMYAFDALNDLAGLRKHCEVAVRYLPQNAFVQYVLATLELKFGDFEQGWQRWKWHEKTNLFRKPVQVNFPEWCGEPVRHARFLLVKELGSGDQIQFLQLVHWLHEKGAIVDVWVDGTLGELARSVDGVNAVWTEEPPGPYDYCCHMLRMPAVMKLDLSMLPLACGYVKAAPEKRRHWRSYLGDPTPRTSHVKPANHSKPATRKRVGLVWAGDPTHPFDHHRSINLDTLRPLLMTPAITWYSVQKGARERECEAIKDEIDIHILGPDIVDFTDTLAILESLDLLITVDTSVAHLAGAAGLPVWVLLPACADWRWLIDRADSPWYPSMRLFRQQELGDWQPVIQAVREALQITPDA